MTLGLPLKLFACHFDPFSVQPLLMRVFMLPNVVKKQLIHFSNKINFPIFTGFRSQLVHKEERSLLTMISKFSELSSLVLVDTLAALPMDSTRSERVQLT